jgi:ferritin-like metal-binding protein YciE
MKAESLRDLYIEQLQDLYSAENQLVKALPKMAKGATSEELREAINEHLEVTKNQASRLEEIFSNLGEDPKGKKCKGMEGLVEEGSEVLEQDMDDDVRDAALIAGAQRVEHYEIAGYGTVRTYANLLGEDEAAATLEEILNEEKEADTRLSSLAEEINVEANIETEGEEAEGQEVEGENIEQPAKKGHKAGGRGRGRSAA